MSINNRKSSGHPEPLRMMYAPATAFLTITPASQDFPLVSGFIQDEIAVVPKRPSLMQAERSHAIGSQVLIFSRLCTDTWWIHY